MIQRIQTVYLFVAALLMAVAAFFSFSNVAVGITALLTACISLYDITLFKKRPLQANICRILCLAGIAFISYFCIVHADNYAKKGFVYPVIATALAVFCWFLASIAIRKDEKLVRSLDRIR